MARTPAGFFCRLLVRRGPAPGPRRKKGGENVVQNPERPGGSICPPVRAEGCPRPVCADAGRGNCPAGPGDSPGPQGENLGAGPALGRGPQKIKRARGRTAPAASLPLPAPPFYPLGKAAPFPWGKGGEKMRT
ncbi:MAG: hypothetical protein QW260_05535, partial [Thermoproteota archaeon]